MANLNYAELYTKALDQAFPNVLHFGALYATPNNGRYKWVDAKTIKIPHITTSGRVNANRDTIATASRNYDNSWQTKTLSFERKWSTLVHPMDIDETNMTATIGNITQTFNQEQKFPEIDAYTISKIYHDYTTTVSSEGYTAGTPIDTGDYSLTSDNCINVFDTMMLNMNNANVPAAGRILYVTNEVHTMLKNTGKVQRTWDAKDGGTALNRAIDSLDGVQIIPVPASLMKTAYTFTTGFAPASGAKQIYMFLVHPLAVITPGKYEFVKLDAPSAGSEGKYVYYEEDYRDAFILNNKAGAIQFYIEA